MSCLKTLVASHHMNMMTLILQPKQRKQLNSLICWMHAVRGQVSLPQRTWSSQRRRELGADCDRPIRCESRTPGWSWRLTLAEGLFVCASLIGSTCSHMILNRSATWRGSCATQSHDCHKLETCKLVSAAVYVGPSTSSAGTLKQQIPPSTRPMV